MQIIVPLAGKSPFFPPEHYFFPKSLVEVRGRPMVEWVIENLKCFQPGARFIFIVHQEEVARFSLDRTLRFLTDDLCDIVALRKPTQGALCSALLAIDHLDMNEPVVVSNGDQLIDADLPNILASFRHNGARASSLSTAFIRAGPMSPWTTTEPSRKRPKRM
jgi:NDP-sugar pyrophosphorylase family protein